MDSAPNPVCSVWYHKTSAWATIALPDSSAWSRDCPPVLVVSVSESIRAWMCLILPLCCIYPSLTGYLWFCPCFTLLPVFASIWSSVWFSSMSQLRVPKRLIGALCLIWIPCPTAYRLLPLTSLWCLDRKLHQFNPAQSTNTNAVQFSAR